MADDGDEKPIHINIKGARAARNDFGPFLTVPFSRLLEHPRTAWNSGNCSLLFDSWILGDRSVFRETRTGTGDASKSYALDVSFRLFPRRKIVDLPRRHIWTVNLDTLVVGQDQNEIAFKIKRTTPLKKLMVGHGSL
jgi:hypothetical protein